MEIGDRLGTQFGSTNFSGPDLLIEASKRRFLQAAGILVAGMMLPKGRAETINAMPSDSGHKVLLVVIGGVRRAETFSGGGLVNIPHLAA